MTYSPNEAFSAPAYGATAVNYAPWLSRVGNYLIDGLVTAPFALLAVLFGRGTDAETGLPTINALYWVFLLLGLALSGYNRWYLGGRTGQSWGRKALGIRLVGEQTGQPIGVGMAFARDLAHIVDSIICNIGYLFPLWDAKKQTLADKIVKTVVVR
jgi:uncharacterized RDD family membrane protein YckC